MLMQPQFENILSDHFSLFPIIISPLYWITGSYTMLLFQIIMILLGGVGIFRYFSEITSDTNFSLMAMINFFATWGIYSALAFDYHDNVIASMLVPWLFLYYYKEKKIMTLLVFILICISKENMALWAIFISLGLALSDYSYPKKRTFALVLSLIACVYFISVITLIMPSIANANRPYLHFHYNALGENVSDAIQTVITKPMYTLSLLFQNHLPDQGYNGIKTELHLMILFSGGLGLLFRPQYLLMLIPIYAQKLFNDDYIKWGLNSHYSIEFVPILTLAIFSAIGKIKYKKTLGIIICLVTIIATYITLQSRKSLWYDKKLSRFYTAEHFKTPYNPSTIYKLLKLIPDSVSVSASGALVPHLAFREYIYQFPDGENADYIAILLNGKTYPLSNVDFNNKMESLKKSGQFDVIADDLFITIFKRKEAIILKK